MGIRVGLDIGVASVGWTVISVEDEIKILESGSNLFECADASKNVDRRSARQVRRLTRRRKTRIFDYQKLWENSGMQIPEDVCNNQLELRVNGLQQELSLDEIYWVLLTMLKHRGISYLDDAEFDGAVSGSDYQKGLSINQKKINEGQYPCQIQLDRLLRYGKYRGQISVSEEDENIILSNVFTTSAYQAEVEHFLEKQQEYHTQISPEFVKKYLEIFGRKRAYYEGPGNELSRTDYGIYTTALDDTGKYITEQNLFSRLIGHCSVKPDEERAAGASFTAQEFNALNDLCNLKVNGEKLTEEQKRAIIFEYKNATTVSPRKIIKKAIAEDIVSLEGARIDKSEKELFHTMETYRKLKKALAELDVDIDAYDVALWDEVARILTINTERDGILTALDDADIHFSSDETKEQAIRDLLIMFRRKNGASFSKWQSFGLSIMHDMIPIMYSQPKNQMQILTDMGVFKSRVDCYKESKYIPKDIVTNEIYNPVVVRSVRVTINILNALIKKYGVLEEVVIEMPRDRNEEEQRKRITDAQKKNEKELNTILDHIKDAYSIRIQEEDFRKQKNLVMKLKLWNEQDGVCLYSGKSIAIEDLLNEPQMFEIDHIIPKSISFDDSRSNKVLVYATENQKKGNMTPYMYLHEINREYDFHEFMSMVLTRKNALGTKKVNNLLNREDITKVGVLKGFINRNLNDTRYASRVVLNSLQDYFKAHETGTKVKVVRGAFTSEMRKALRLSKNRDETYAHHAVDAMIMCFAMMGYEDYQVLMRQVVDFDSEEIKDRNRWNEVFTDRTYEEQMYANRLYTIKRLISDAEKQVKYWHKVDTKPNRGLSNATIYGTREYEGKTFKINKLDIYSAAPSNGYKTLKKMIEDGNQDRILMYKNDPRTWQDLMSIYRMYPDATNPFKEYEKETGDYLRKYSKKHNGPKITTLKYIDGEVNSCIDLSQNYGFEKGSKKVILDSLKPYRMDVWYHEPSQAYYLVGVKYADLKADGSIDEENYTRSLISEGVLKEGQSYNQLHELGFRMTDSFYKNDIIYYEKNGEYFTERFLSRTMPRKRNYIETKPIDAPKFSKQDRHQFGLGKTSCIRKYHVDILGNMYFG